VKPLEKIENDSFNKGALKRIFAVMFFYFTIIDDLVKFDFVFA